MFSSRAALLSDVTDGEMWRGSWKPSKASFLRRLFAVGGAGQIFTAAVVAIVLALIVHRVVGDVPEEVYKLVKLPGGLWIRALKAVVVPLVLTSMITTMVRLRSVPGRSGKLMGLSMGYYMTTTLFAAAIGIVMANLLLVPNITPLDLDLPDDGEDQEHLAPVTRGTDFKVADQVVAIFTDFIPVNVFRAMADDKLLAIIITSILLGLLLPTGEDGKILGIATEIETVATRIVNGLIAIAPIGVFFLLLAENLRSDITTLAKHVGLIIAVHIASLATHFLLLYQSLYLLIVRRNPFTYAWGASSAIITAFGTSSSAAAYPVSCECAAKLRVPENVSRFTLPLGMTLNMDGSAITFPLYIFWVAYSQGYVLDFAEMLFIAIVTTLISVGSTPIPSSGQVMVVLVAQSLSIPAERMYPLILAIDWLVDRFRTAVNVAGDLYAAAIISKLLLGRVDGSELVEESHYSERGSPDKSSTPSSCCVKIV